MVVREAEHGVGVEVDRDVVLLVVGEYGLEFCELRQPEHTILSVLSASSARAASFL